MRYSKKIDASGYLLRLIKDIKDSEGKLSAGEIESDLQVLLGKIRNLEKASDDAEDFVENL